MIIILVILLVLSSTITILAKENKESIKGSITIIKLKQRGESTTSTGKENPEHGHVPLEGIKYKLYKTSFDMGEIDEDIDFDIDSNKAIKEGVTNSEGKLVFEDLDLGVYYLHEEDHDGIEKANSFFVTVPTTSPKGDELIYDIFIYPKNDVKNFDIDLNKYVNQINKENYFYELDEEIEWIIQTTKPKTISLNQNNLEYKIIDEYSDKMEFLSETLSIRIGQETLDNSKDYILTEFTEKNKFEIKFKGSGIKKIAESESEKIEVKYKTKTKKEKIINSLCEKIENNVEVSYKADYYDDIKIKEIDEKPYIYTKGIKILKYDKKDKDIKLEGAEFELYRISEDGEVKIDAYSIEDGKIEKNNKFITNINGEVVIYGLKPGEYYLKETKAPIDSTGVRYNLLRKKVNFTIEDGFDKDDCIKIIDVPNSKGFELPQTGGIGTRIFILGGISLLGLSLIIKKNDMDEIE
ncbi:MAG TPA: SpaH/EbpB family LPXTG-anchored major pilin, partial [Tissierellaceae bacterium]